MRKKGRAQGVVCYEYKSFIFIKADFAKDKVDLTGIFIHMGTYTWNILYFKILPAISSAGRHCLAAAGLPSLSED